MNGSEDELGPHSGVQRPAPSAWHAPPRTRDTPGMSHDASVKGAPARSDDHARWSAPPIQGRGRTCCSGEETSKRPRPQRYVVGYGALRVRRAWVVHTVPQHAWLTCAITSAAVLRGISITKLALLTFRSACAGWHAHQRARQCVACARTFNRYMPRQILPPPLKLRSSSRRSSEA
jgi:hypothetical protein